MRWTVHSLNTAKGTRLDAFLDGLSDDDAAAEAEALVEMLEEHGNNLRRPTCAPLGHGLFEARGLTTGVRLFFVYAPGASDHRARRIHQETHENSDEHPGTNSKVAEGC